MLCKVNEDGSLSEVASNGGGLINDEKTSENETWSSKKINDSLVDKADLRIVNATDANDCWPEDGLTSAVYQLLNGSANLPIVGHFILTVNRLSNTHCQQIAQSCSGSASSIKTSMFYRDGLHNGTQWVWSDWKELATMDKVVNASEGTVLNADATYSITSETQYNTLTIKGLMGRQVIYDLIPLNREALNPIVKHLGDYTDITVSNFTETSCEVTIPKSCRVIIKSTFGGITVTKV